MVLVCCMLMSTFLVNTIAMHQINEGNSVASSFVTEPMVATGHNHTVALSGDGNVWAWGANWTGQLGDGTTNISSHTPVQVKNLNNVIAIDAGVRTVALRYDGTVWTWGDNSYGGLGNATTINSSIPVQVHNLNNVIAIASGWHHTVALRDDGNVWMWGATSLLQNDVRTTYTSVPIQVQGINDVIAIAAGSSYTIALRNDGTVWKWSLLTGIPMQVKNLDGVTAIATADSYSIGLRDDGTVWAWGQWPTTAGHVVYIGNTPVQIENLSNVISICAELESAMALKDDGTVWSLRVHQRRRYPFTQQISHLSNITAIATTGSGTIGGGHSVVVRRDGTVWAWGQNFNGELGVGTRRHHSIPVQVVGANNVGYLNLGISGLPPVELPTPSPPSINIIPPTNNQLVELFSQHSYAYNHELARLGVRLSTIAYGREDDESKPEPIYNKLSELGFDHIIQGNYHPIQRPNHHVVGYTLAYQKIEINGVLRPVVFVVIRGTTGDDQWHSNFTIGHRYEHYGFSRAEQDLHMELYEYLAWLKSEGLYNVDNGIIFITGHSRGAAVANLLASELNRTQILVRQENLYAYTFATPNTTLRPIAFRNIFNFVNAEDFVVYLPLNAGWGFWKHGRTFAFPSRGLVDNDIFEQHRDNVTRIYGDLSGGSRPLFRRAGINPIIQVVAQFQGVAPTVYDFYNTSRFAGGGSLNNIASYTPNEFMTIVADAAAGNLLARLKLVEISGGYIVAINPNRYWAIAHFFINEARLNTDWSFRDNPHDENMYRAWMYAISEDDLIEHLFIEHSAFGRSRIIRIACPVDIRVYDSSNQLVGRVIDNVVDDTIETDIFIFVDGDVKYIYVSAFGTYTVHFTATDTGIMTYTIEDVEILTMRTIEQKEFENVALYAGREMVSEIIANTPDVRLLIVDNGEIIGEIIEDGTEILFNNEEEIPVTSISITESDIHTILEGQTLQLTTTIVPTNATTPNITWTSSNEMVASVSANGQITATSAGTAVITVHTENGHNDSVTINVTAQQGDNNIGNGSVSPSPQTPIPTPTPNVKTPPLSERGSTQGNFATGNPVGFSANHIYFSNTADFRLWRMDYNGGSRQRVGNFNLPRHIQYYDGWLYFTHNTGQAIIRLNTNNHNEYHELINRQRMGQIQMMQVINNLIYFSTSDEEGLHKIPLNGGTPETVVNIALDGFTVTEEEIFIRYNRNLYRYGLDGTRLNLVVQNFPEERVSVYDGWVYYVTSWLYQGGEHEYIIRIRPDGTEREVVFYARVNNWVENIWVGTSPVNVTDGWIYFWEVYDMAPASWRNDNRVIARMVLCRVRVDGTGFQELVRCNQLSPNSTLRSDFAVHDGFVYVMANNHNYRVGNSELYRVPINGGRVELLQARSQ